MFNRIWKGEYETKELTEYQLWAELAPHHKDLNAVINFMLDKPNQWTVETPFAHYAYFETEDSIKSYLDKIQDLEPVFDYLWKEVKTEMIEYVRERMSDDDLFQFIEDAVGGSIRWLSEKEIYG